MICDTADFIIGHLSFCRNQQVPADMQHKYIEIGLREIKDVAEADRDLFGFLGANCGDLPKRM